MKRRSVRAWAVKYHGEFFMIDSWLKKHELFGKAENTFPDDTFKLVRVTITEAPKRTGKKRGKS